MSASSFRTNSVFAVVAVLTGFGCGDVCVRNSDCPDPLTCSSGVCAMPVSGEGGTADAAATDAMTEGDSGMAMGPSDGGNGDSALPDVGVPDASLPDAGSLDAGTVDGSTLDAGTLDTGMPDASDGGVTDSATTDGDLDGAVSDGTVDGGAGDASPDTSLL